MRTAAVLRPDLPGNAPFLVAGAAAAALAGYALEGHSVFLIGLACAIPLLLWVVQQPAILLVALGATLPVLNAIPGFPGGFRGTFSDLLLIAILAVVALRWLVTRDGSDFTALRPLAMALVPISIVMLLLAAVHFSGGGVAQTLQRFELFLVPLVVGAFAVRLGRHVLLLQAYVLATSAYAVLWPLDVLGGQKNPVGQLIGNAILLLIAVRPLRRLYPCLVILVPGLLLTQSRGAIIATGVGVLVIVLLERMSTQTLLYKLVPVVVVCATAFALIPASAQDRITTFSSGENSKAAWAIKIREQYAEDAHTIINTHDWLGVGIGNYGSAGRSLGLAGVDDPHQVLLLQQAEGGYLLVVAFILLVGGAAVALVRFRSLELAPAAAAVLVATAVHGLVDVYWVRGTPVLGWLLVGMVCALAAQGARRREEEA